MFIKELEITGFKSFANKVKLSFDRQISAIVGPNGCGKSNVLDAMKWVLGEKSIKSMRGEKSEDVIFSGTETIKPSGYASVLFTLDNSQRMLDVDSDEVKIGRNLYRDGQSQYFLNSAKVTRKEIEHALMDTGLGKSSYSFMEQGKMDMILSSRPEERRILFEEAAGISKFKSQKEEALRNLENTQINITRLKDVQKELYRELKIKEDQAKKTKVYNDLMNQKKENELKIYFLSLSENEENLEKYNEALQKKMEEKEKISQKLLLYEESIKQLDKEKEERKKEFHQKDTANRINREKINQWEQAIQNEEKRKKDLLNNLEIQKEQIKKNKIRFENLKKEFDSQNQLTLQLDTKLENAQKALASMAENIKKIEKEITENELKLKSYNDELKENKKTLEDLRLEYEKVVKDLLKSLKEEKDKWLFHEKERLNIKNNVVSEIFHIIETLAGIQELLNKKNIDAALENVKKEISRIKNKNWDKLLESVAEFSEGLKHLLFEKGGIHSQKEEIDEKISLTESRNSQLETLKEKTQKNIEWLREDISNKSSQKESLAGDIKSFHVQKDGLIEREKKLKEQIKHEEGQLQYFTKQGERIEGEVLQLEKNKHEIIKKIDELKKGIEKDIAAIYAIEKKITLTDKKKTELYAQIHNENNKNSNLFKSVGDLEIKIGTLIGSKEALLQEIYNDYTLTYGEIKEKFERSKIIPEKEKELLKNLKKEIEILGPINPLAFEELKNITELYNANENQIKDITAAKENIVKILEEIDEKSRVLFLESFEKIQHNFSEVFQKLFNGGKAKLSLLEPENPLTSGIDIQVQPPGKRPRSLRLLSGGEKALTAIALMFGIYMVRSSPFCVLDEIDAPLDDLNVARFLSILDEFRNNTQFILITHNKKTMAKAESLFGVTMEEAGISKVLSVELKSA